MAEYLITMHSDGGSRGNPGPAAIGVVVEIKSVKTGKEKTLTISRAIGNSTNNVAEYHALVAGLETIGNTIGESSADVLVKLDSLLVVNQVNGLFKVKDATLREYLFKVREAENSHRLTVRYVHIPREKNSQADALVNRALDQI